MRAHHQPPVTQAAGRLIVALVIGLSAYLLVAMISELPQQNRGIINLG